MNILYIIAIEQIRTYRIPTYYEVSHSFQLLVSSFSQVKLQVNAFFRNFYTFQGAKLIKAPITTFVLNPFTFGVLIPFVLLIQ